MHITELELEGTSGKRTNGKRTANEDFFKNGTSRSSTFNILLNSIQIRNW